MNKFKNYLSGRIVPEGKVRKPKAGWLWAASFGLALIFTVVASQAEGQAPFTFSLEPASDVIDDHDDHDKTTKDFVPPTVFQAAGPNAASIQSSVDAFRAALGNPNNGNNTAQLAGHREINWDGVGGVDTTTTAPVTPFNAFLNTRGSQFTTPGIGLSQAPPSGGAQGGLAVLFNNPSYGTIFSPFSNFRLFTPVGSNITNALFFVPGSGGTVPATVTGFGAVFSDVDQPDGSGPSKRHEREGREREEDRRDNRRASTLMEFFDADGQLLFSSFVPASPGDAGFSFFGIKFNDARIASVRIKTGDVAPGPDDERKSDIVMMDDFIYGEPLALP